MVPFFPTQFSPPGPLFSHRFPTFFQPRPPFALFAFPLKSSFALFAFDDAGVLDRALLFPTSPPPATTPNFAPDEDPAKPHGTNRPISSCSRPQARIASRLDQVSIQ